MKNILFICNGIALMSDDKLGMSGGDARFFEVYKYTQGFNKSLLVAHYGNKLAEKMELEYDKKYVIPYRVNPEIKSNLVISLKSLFQFPKGLNSFHGIVYSSCEHLYDVLPAARLKIFNKCRWIAVYHWVEDYPWREKRGGTPLLKRYLYWLNRYVSGLVIKLFADEIFAVSETTKQKLVDIKHINPNRITPVLCGVDMKAISSAVEKYRDEKGKVYDAVYMKRLSHGKGAFDLLEIWKKVVAKKSDAKLAIIGPGSEDTLKAIGDFITVNKLEKNIDLLGPIYDLDNKYRIINSAKVFILPTYEENWAIVIGEAMAASLPVVCYKLKEITPIWKDNLTWIELGDTQAFANDVLELIADKAKQAKMADKAFQFVKQFDWQAIGESELAKYK